MVFFSMDMIWYEALNAMQTYSHGLAVLETSAKVALQGRLGAGQSVDIVPNTIVVHHISVVHLANFILLIITAAFHIKII